MKIFNILTQAFSRVLQLTVKPARYCSYPLLKLTDEDFVNTLASHSTPFKIIPSADRVKVLKRALSLKALSPYEARNNLIFTSIWCPNIFPSVLECALKSTNTLKTELQLFAAITLISQYRQPKNTAEALAFALKEHRDLIFKFLPNTKEPSKHETRLAVILLVAVGEKLNPTQLETLQTYFPDMPYFAKLCQSSKHQALSRHKLTQNVDAAELIRMSNRAFQKFIIEQNLPRSGSPL